MLNHIVQSFTHLSNTKKTAITAEILLYKSMATNRNNTQNMSKTDRKTHQDREIVPVMIVGKGRGARIGARYKDDEFSVVKDAEGLAVPFKSL